MATITYLTKIQFDFGAVQLLADEMAELGISRPLFVTDKGVRAAGLLDQVMEHLADNSAAEIFD
ncbi:MAG: iron-containing alcohol dehydrogenase, partial [Rhodospirillaceae bacterium]|nr:iron-containing alcohol dehydrogenase [Rhodospirillaceae bacterium]